MTALILVAFLAQQHPNTFVDKGEIDAIKAKVAAGAAPWKTAYDRMLADAEAALKQGDLSVTAGGKAPPSGDPHDFWTEAPYAGTGDGVVNPANDRTDYIAATALGKAVRNLGLAYAFTGQSKYADKAVRLIRAWCVTPATRMNPKYTNAQSQIELSITIPGVFYGADLIWDHAGWTDRAAFVAWAKSFAGSAKGWSRKNNFENWRVVTLATAGVVTEDAALRAYAFDRWKAILPDQMAANGRLVQETGRTRSLDYSTYALNAMVLGAEVARHHGVDLYGYRLADGRGLEKSLDYHAPYVTNPSTWTYQQISPYNGDNAALFELAYRWKQKPAYLAAINKWKRPMTETRVAGPVTLTHAYGTSPVPAPSPEPAPTPVPPGSTGQPALDRLQLIDMDTLRPLLDPLRNGAVLDLSTLPDVNMNVFVIPASGTASVRFAWDGNANHRTESSAPYALFGDGAGYVPWRPSPGQHTVTATPYSASGAGGTAGAPLTVAFTVVGAAPSAVAGATTADADRSSHGGECGLLGAELIVAAGLLALRKPAGRGKSRYET